jgi:UDPglucose--hexose-1-phosphate uridylyltransferase
MGAFINDTTPESVAERLRAVTLPTAPSAVHSPVPSGVPLGAVSEGAHA